ncbi:UDP-N-acetylmuramoyl-L-alanyl-D-glutamate--2,6-diaminopimelate ligase [Nocardioides insulae]|uniref:UDP-N-acetylmuramoyl-L-alanyl-D-glutamate--2, 6-diaminopimelate ligase n=1 Tax=Nocardioides insulae TaxID=394734 RepID=UPI000413CEDB|nr:UDP-N-acetylmuramoyl-L-alanyl-D-glutamate--2,6-diaminopimelate ligase [Nocardioides insulae]
MSSTADPATRPEHPRPVRLGDLTGEDLRLSGDPETLVTGMSLSSQRVLPGDLYAALPGSRAHGIDYATQALAAGATALLTDPAGADQADALELGIPVLVTERPRAVLGMLAARVYGAPAERLRMIGVTGTQGKTTTTRLAEGGLEQAGVPAGVIGTVGTRMLGQDVPTTLTTPEAPDLHGLFARMLEQGVDVCAMEVSSHALVMGRVDGVVFDVAVFLNLGRDHLDFHTDIEDYYAAKASLFTPERARMGLVCVDDAHGRRLAQEATIPVRTFSVALGPTGGAADDAGPLRADDQAWSRNADWRAVDLTLRPDGSDFRILGPGLGEGLAAHCPLPGDFNVTNTLAAVAACAEAGLDPARVAAGIAASGGVPGRLERVSVDATDEQPTVIVDYAHKPDAVEAALRTLRPLTSGRVLVVIGAGGDRDTGKRPLMGEIAARLADVVLITDDNPRSEDPATIRAAMLEGARAGAGGARVIEVSDGRRAAIQRAVRDAGPEDIVLIAGKGHETGQEVRGVVHPFDDRTVAREALLTR